MKKKSKLTAPTSRMSAWIKFRITRIQTVWRKKRKMISYKTLFRTTPRKTIKKTGGVVSNRACPFVP